MSSKTLMPMVLKEVAPCLIKKLKPFWPKTIVACSILETYIRWEDSIPEAEVIILGPEGSPESGTFVIFEAKVSLNVFVTSIDDDLESFKQMLINCEYIDWNAKLTFGPTISKYHGMLADVFAAKNLVQSHGNVETEAYFLENNAARKITFQCPEEVYLGRVSPNYAKLINDAWPHKSEGSEKLVECMLRNRSGLGVFQKADDELLAWFLHDEYGCPGLLHTVPKARRKGYALLVAAALTKEFGEEDLTPTVFIVKGNAASKALFKNLGYKSYDFITWFCVCKPQLITN